MGYFKKRREKKEAARRGAILLYLDHQTTMVGDEMFERFNQVARKADTKRLEHENNVRENLEAMIEDGSIMKLSYEIADVIEAGMELYSYRIAKGKREELAQDILVALSVKK